MCAQENPTEHSKGTNDTSDQDRSEEVEGEEAVDMTQEFIGDMGDVANQESDECVSGG